jgi:leucyl-tRNA synthetase
MSKSKGNVINPTDIIQKYGADTLRLYIMFIGDYEKPAPWSDNGVKGCKRFLDRVWKLQDMIVDENEISKDLETSIHKTIKKVSHDYEDMKFNTAIAALMSLLNDFNKKDKITKQDFKIFIQLLNPVAPHITEELWELSGFDKYLNQSTWPEYDEEKTIDNVIEMAVQINGKVRGTITIPNDASKEIAKEHALLNVNINKYIENKNIIKEIYVPGKIFNIVVK